MPVAATSAKAHRRIVEPAEVARGRPRVGVERDRERGAGLRSRRLTVGNAGGQKSKARCDIHTQMLERVGGRARPCAHPIEQSGHGLVRKPEHRRLISREIDDARVGFAREHERGRGRDHRSAGAALRRPEAHEHESLPTSGRTEAQLAARDNTTGKERGKPTRTLGGRGSYVKGHVEPREREENVGFALVEAAFFDLDKTVIATSSVMALGGTFYRDGLISKRTIVRGLYAQVVYLLVGADDNKMERMREAMLALTKGWDQQHVQELVRETLDVVITPIIYAEALELIEEHRKAGRKTVIVSSSPAETVEPIGEYLGVDDVIATRARLDEEGPLHGRARVLRVRVTQGRRRARDGGRRTSRSRVVVRVFRLDHRPPDAGARRAPRRRESRSRVGARRPRARVGGPVLPTTGPSARPCAGAAEGPDPRGRRLRDRGGRGGRRLRLAPPARVLGLKARVEGRV